MATSHWFLALTHSTCNLIGPWTTHTNTQSHTDTTCRAAQTTKIAQKRQQKPESGIKDGFEERQHERNLSFTLPFFTRKVSTVTFSEEGYTLSRSQNDKTTDITFDNLFPPLRHSR